MKFKIYRTTKNDYLGRMFFDSLNSYSDDVECINSLDGLKDSNLLIDAEQLPPETIVRLKNDGNIIISFDINDHTTPTHSYRNTPEIHCCELIFKFAGIQKERMSCDIKINDDLTYSEKEIPFMEEAEWKSYCSLKEKIRPLPHVPWVDIRDTDLLSYGERIAFPLVRGSVHTLRYHLFLKLLNLNIISGLSSFFTAPYRNRFCDPCKEELRVKGKLSHDYYKQSSQKCSSDLKWQDPLTDGFWDNDRGLWNCQCPNMYYFLAEKFAEKHGSINMYFLEQALNGRGVHNFPETVVSRHVFYADFKWIHSIYAPPRFWEAAAVKTVNLYPKFSSEQTLFPGLEEGKHYKTFNADLSNLEQTVNISEEEYVDISENTFEIYNKWIKRDCDQKISSSLMNHILTECRNVAIT